MRVVLPVALVGALAPACVAPSGAVLDRGIDEAKAPMVDGACADACWMIESYICDWRSACSHTTYGPEACICNKQVIYCDAAELAAGGTAFGLEFCYRECEGLH